MKGKVVLITGATVGIGRATALAFAKEGARLVVAGRREVEGHQLVEELRGMGAEAEFVRTDVRNEEEIRGVVERAVSRFGRLDAAVNNAGVEGERTPITEHTAETLAKIFDTNVVGTLLSMKYELRVMIPQGSGSIINLSSTFGQRGGAGYSAYVASKHAIEGFTKAAALEVAAHGIRVNAVAPGPIETSMLDRFTGSPEIKKGFLTQLPTQRFGRPEEVAQTILFLASDKAPYITGQAIGIDGGLLAR